MERSRGTKRGVVRLMSAWASEGPENRLQRMQNVEQRNVIRRTLHLIKLAFVVLINADNYIIIYNS